MATDYEYARDEILHIHRPEPRRFAHFDSHCVVCDTVYPCRTVQVFDLRVDNGPHTRDN